MRSLLGAVAGIAMAALMAAPAQATLVEDITFSSTLPGQLDFTGQFTAADAINLDGSHSILSVTGTFSGVASGAVTGLIAGGSTPPDTTTFGSPSGNSWTVNDVFFTSGTPFDSNGPLMKFDTNNYANFFFVGSQGFVSLDSPSDFFIPGIAGIFTVSEASAVPGPIVGAGLPGIIMLAGGLLALRRRRLGQDTAA